MTEFPFNLPAAPGVAARLGRAPWIAAGIGLASALGAAGLIAVLSGLPAATEAVAQGPKPEKAAPRPAAQAAPAAAPAAPAPPAAPVRTETVVYDQWTVTCQDRVDGSAKKACNALLKVVDPNRNQVVFAWMLARGADGRVVSVMQTPTGVQIGQGVSLKIGEGQARTMPYASCEPQNCEASAALDPATLTELKGAAQAVATIYAKDGRGIQFTMPIKGIDKALGALQG